MAKDWFYQGNDGEQGPFSGTELKQLVRLGEIGTKTQIRKGTEGRWVAATQVQGLIPVPGSANPNDTISTIVVPPKETVATKSAIVSKPKPDAEPKPIPVPLNQSQTESASTPFDPFAAFSAATDANPSEDQDPSADPAEDPFGFSDTFGNPNALKKKIKAAKSARPTASDSTDPIPKRKAMPHKAILIGMAGVLAVLIGVAGYFFFIKKPAGNGTAVAKSNPPASSDKQTTSSENGDADKAAAKTTVDATDKSATKEAVTTVAKQPEPKPIEVVSKKADAVPTTAFTSEADLFEAVAPSVAMVKGRMGGGSGFLLEGNIVVTNKHVVESELIEKLKIFFPSAGKDGGPYKAELLYTDRDRDIAILRVITNLKPSKIVKNYKFRPGEKVMAIGSPGSIADDHFLENAISTGVMSTRTEVDHKKYFQMNMAVNPGNSGGPVFDYFGNIVGVVTLRGPQQESHGYCIPAEEVEDSLKKQKRVKENEIAEMLSNHRVKAVYSVASESSKIYLTVMAFYLREGIRYPKSTKVKDIVVPVELRTLLKKINQDLHDDIQKYYDEVMEDKNAVSDNLREELKEFWENFQVLKKSAESPDGKLDAYQKNFQEAAKKFVELKPKLKEGLGVEYDH